MNGKMGEWIDVCMDRWRKGGREGGKGKWMERREGGKERRKEEVLRRLQIIYSP